MAWFVLALVAAGCSTTATEARNAARESGVVRSDDETTIVAPPSTGVPDGQPRFVVAFAPAEGASDITAGAPGRIVRYDRATGEITTLAKASEVADDVAYARITAADLSPDGTSVAFVAYWSDRDGPASPNAPDENRSGLFRVASDGTGAVEPLVIAGATVNATPTAVKYSPDGRTLVATVPGAGSDAVLADGTKVIVSEPGGMSMAWSPDGTRLASGLADDMSTNQRTEVSGFDVERRAFTGTLERETIDGVGPWWDTNATLHAKAGVETNTRSGGTLPYDLAIDTDTTFEWVLGSRRTCWPSDIGPEGSVETSAACRLQLPSALQPVAW
jgi:hypothetical protein